MNYKKIISVKETRKLIGKSAETLTNDELEELIDDSETLVRMIIKMYLRSKK